MYKYSMKIITFIVLLLSHTKKNRKFSNRKYNRPSRLSLSKFPESLYFQELPGHFLGIPSFLGSPSQIPSKSLKSSLISLGGLGRVSRESLWSYRGVHGESRP